MSTRKPNDMTLGGKSVSAQIFFRPAQANDSDAAGARTHFERHPAVTEAVRLALVERIRANNPGGAQQFDSASRQNDMIGLFVADAGRNGLDGNDVADVAALYWITAWSVVHRHSPTEQQVAAVRRQVRGALSHAPELRSASDEEKQQMADDMIYQLMLLQAAYQQAWSNNDDKALELLAQTTYRTALQNKVDLRAMHLDDRGLADKADERAAS